jgi:hypothetical protein
MKTKLIIQGNIKMIMKAMLQGIQESRLNCDISGTQVKI